MKEIKEIILADDNPIRIALLQNKDWYSLEVLWELAFKILQKKINASSERIHIPKHFCNFCYFCGTYKIINFSSRVSCRNLSTPLANVVTLQMKSGRRSAGIFGPSRPFERAIQTIWTTHRNNPLGGIEIIRTPR